MNIFKTLKFKINLTKNFNKLYKSSFYLERILNKIKNFKIMIKNQILNFILILMKFTYKYQWGQKN